MDEITLLRTLGEHAGEPDPAALADARARLMSRATGTPVPPRRPRLTRTRVAVLGGLAAAAVAGVLTVSVVGVGSAPPAAAAAEVLRDAASARSSADVPSPGPGQYLEVVRTEAGLAYVQGPGSTYLGAYVDPSVATTWIPADRTGRWVQQTYHLPPTTFYGGAGVHRAAARDALVNATPADPVTERAAGGHFGNGELGGDTTDPLDPLTLPRDPRELLTYLEQADDGVTSGPHDKVMSEVADLLRSGAVPGDLQVALYRALALVPGVVITDDTATLDGRTGTAIGLTGTDGTEIIVDPSTGTYIGERELSDRAVGAVPAGTRMYWTAVTTSVVDDAP